MNPILYGLIATFFSLSICFYYLWVNSESRKTQKRVEQWFELERKKERRSRIFVFGDRYDQSMLSEKLRNRLAKADLRIKASEYTAICLLLFGLLWALTHYFLELLFPLDAVVAQIIVWVGSTYFLNSRKNRFIDHFDKQLPEVCRMMSSTIKAGLTLHQGFELVAKELSRPAGPEFQFVSQQLRLGDDFEEVMQRFQERVESKELQIFISTVMIQRKVGGNLAEILGIMAETLEERFRVGKDIKTATAEAKSVATILPIMPIGMGLMMNVMMPGFLNPLFTPWGLILLAIVVVMQLFAFLLIRQITRIRV
ncbi:type II secretion system F family protein [Brevibacillus migulae]|uniref:type II secretion system F family protein n=1 Tax=Brevibacillus migulae TaxID=1644114 RepID=UPI00106E3971|nr:type II secretion system F family protein [Brevibacillus migulae]